MRKASIKNKLIALWLIPGLGPRRFRNLLDYFGEIDKIFTAPPRDISKITGLDQKSAELIPTALDSKRFNDELQLIEKYKIKVIDYTEDIYPNLLHEIYDAPPILYVRGSSISTMESQSHLSVPEKRHSMAKACAKRLLRDWRN